MLFLLFAFFCALSAFLLVTAGYHVAVLLLPFLSCLLLPLLLIPLRCCLRALLFCSPPLVLVLVMLLVFVLFFFLW